MMKVCKYLIGIIVSMVFVVSSVYALPSNVNTKLSWEPYTNSNYSGFFLYWDFEVSSPRTYVDARRIDLGKPVANSVTIVTVMPTAQDRICFKMTAYRIDPTQTIESGFSNEACGFFGIVGITGLTVGE